MLLVSSLLLFSVIGSKTKAFNNLGGPRKVSKSKDGGMASISSMTEHQYLDPVQNTWFFVVIQPRRWPKKSQIALTKKF